MVITRSGRMSTGTASAAVNSAAKKTAEKTKNASPKKRGVPVVTDKAGSSKSVTRAKRRAVSPEYTTPTKSPKKIVKKETIVEKKITRGVKKIRFPEEEANAEDIVSSPDKRRVSKVKQAPVVKTRTPRKKPEPVQVDKKRTAALKKGTRGAKKPKYTEPDTNGSEVESKLVVEEENEKKPVITVKGRKPRKKADKEPEVSPQSDGGDELDEAVDDEVTGKQVGGRKRGAKKTAKQTKTPSKSAKASASDDEAPKEKKAPAKKATRTAKGKKAASKKEDLNQDNSEPEDIREDVESKPEPEVEKAPEPEVTAKGKRLRKKANKDPEPSSESSENNGGEEANEPVEEEETLKTTKGKKPKATAEKEPEPSPENDVGDELNGEEEDEERCKQTNESEKKAEKESEPSPQKDDIDEMEVQELDTIVNEPEPDGSAPNKRKRILEIDEADEDKIEAMKRQKTETLRVKDLSVCQIPGTSGQLMTFGDDTCGELGLSVITISKSKPTPIEGLTSIVSVAAGAMHTVCINSEGEVLTCGCNDEFALGRMATDDNEAIFLKAPVLVKVVKITAGDSHTAALTAQGAVYNWGNFRDQNGRIGLTQDSTESVLDPTPVKLDTTIVDIASGCNHFLFLSEKGEVYTLGVGEQGALGRLPEADCKFAKDVSARFLIPKKIVVNKNEVFDKVWAGSYTSFARSVTGKVYAWGLNNFCQLGFRSNSGDETASSVEYFPKLVPSFTRSQAKVVHICGGNHHSLALDEEGRVYSCGRCEYGRLGHGENTGDEETFKLIDSFKEKVVHISCGPVCSFAVTENGSLYAWGMASANLGVAGGESDVHVPTLVKAKSLANRRVLAVTSGSQHTAIIATSGDGNHNGN